MDGKTLTDLISIPLFTGVMGYVTNWTGVLMLFKPIGFHGVRVPGLRMLFPYLPRRIRILPLIRYDGRLGWQGIVPSRADKMASISVDKGLAKLGSIGDFYRELEPDRIAEHLTAIAQGEIRDVVEEIMRRENPQLWHDLPPVIKEAVFARVRGQLPAIVKSLTEEIGENVDQLIDAKLMVIGYFRKNPELLNELFLIMGRKELTFMKNFGFYFGVPMGFVLFGILQAYPAWWILPLGGVIIGWVVNWIGVTMIFEPVFPRRWVPWRQGLLVKRQPEVSELSSAGAITIDNVSVPALTVRRADTTLDLASGQSFAIAGLLQNSVTQDINKFPWLGDVPVLGTLFRSQAYQRNETELVIIATPYIVRPVATASRLQSPTDGYVPSSDNDLLWRGSEFKAQVVKHGAAPVGPTGGALVGPVGFDLD